MAELTPIAQWIERHRQRTIDPRTGEPISERKLSTEAGLDVGAINRYMHGAQPVPEACTKLALFFSTPERVINPDYLMWLAHHRAYEAPEFIEMEPPPLTDEQADAIIRAILGDDLYEALSKMIKTPGGREFLTARINEMLGKME